MLIACGLGLAVGLTRFTLVLKDNLRDGVTNWAGLALLAVIMASVTVMLLLASAAAGFFAGVLLDAILHRSNAVSRNPARKAVAE